MEVGLDFREKESALPLSGIEQRFFGRTSLKRVAIYSYTRCGICASYDFICRVLCRFVEMWAGVVVGGGVFYWNR
jgi:hypothetical protein